MAGIGEQAYSWPQPVSQVETRTAIKSLYQWFNDPFLRSKKDRAIRKDGASSGPQEEGGQIFFP